MVDPVAVLARLCHRRPPIAWAIALASLIPFAGAPATDRPVCVLLSIDPSDAPLAGALVFARQHCVRCHPLVTKERQVGPDLGRVLRVGTVLDLAGAFWNHAPAMREQMQDLRVDPPRMTSSEMADLLAFLSAYRSYLLEISEQANPRAGRAVFVTKRCAECHDLDEMAAGKSRPSLAKYRQQPSTSFLAQAMWNHRPQMSLRMRQRGVPWPKFYGDDMADLIAYLQVGNAGRDKARISFQPGSPRRGRELLSTKRCTLCHAIAGVGGRRAPDLGVSLGGNPRSVSQIAGVMWNHSEGMAAELRRRRMEWVTFSGRDMVDIIAYLCFVNYTNVRGTPERGGRVFAMRCAGCHAGHSDSRRNPRPAVPRLMRPIDVITALWNHERHAAKRTPAGGLPWPRLGPAETADLTAFLVTQTRSGK